MQDLYPVNNQSKLKCLMEIAQEGDYAFMDFSESHLSPDITGEEIRIENYTSFRTARKNRRHGSVVLSPN